MKYLTLAWWCGEDERESDPRAEYEHHLSAIRDRLPPDLLAAQQSLDLHVSRLRTEDVRPLAATATLTLESRDGSEPFSRSCGGVEVFERTACSSRRASS